MQEKPESLMGQTGLDRRFLVRLYERFHPTCPLKMKLINRSSSNAFNKLLLAKHYSVFKIWLGQYENEFLFKQGSR
jgi:hypothetical protein